MVLKETLRITEIFSSIQGESSKVGLPSTFIRLTGCPLRCQYCDTSYAFTGGERITFDEIFSQVKSIGNRDICVTGGEPLAQNEAKDFLKKLTALQYHVSLETSGSISIDNIDSRVKIVMDIKTPSSTEEKQNRYENLSLLQSKDQLKFVIASRSDFDWSCDLLKKNQVKSEVLFSPVYESLEPVQLADWILEKKINVRLQVQLHKILWGDQKGK